MRTDEYGCEMVERKAVGKSWKFYFYGTGVGVGLVLGLLLSHTVSSPISQSQAAAPSTTMSMTPGAAWHVSARLPTLVGAEAEVFRRVNTTLSAALKN